MALAVTLITLEFAHTVVLVSGKNGNFKRKKEQSLYSV
jgi:hypothetical protein